MFWFFLTALLLVSFVWALVSLRRESSHPKEVRRIRKELKREKILFKA